MVSRSEEERYLRANVCLAWCGRCAGGEAVNSVIAKIKNFLSYRRGSRGCRMMRYFMICQLLFKKRAVMIGT